MGHSNGSSIPFAARGATGRQAGVSVATSELSQVFASTARAGSSRPLGFASKGSNGCTDSPRTAHVRKFAPYLHVPPPRNVLEMGSIIKRL